MYSTKMYSIYTIKWKHVYISMVHKTGKRIDYPKYSRPISLLNLFSNIFEKLLSPKLLELNPSSRQHHLGLVYHIFAPNSYTELQTKYQTRLKTKSFALALLLTLKNHSWHDGLLYKITPHLPDTYFRLLQSFLFNRTYSVNIKNSLPTPYEIVEVQHDEMQG